jgi:hypothetical protein
MQHQNFYLGISTLRGPINVICDIPFPIASTEIIYLVLETRVEIYCNIYRGHFDFFILASRCVTFVIKTFAM